MTVHLQPAAAMSASRIPCARAGATSLLRTTGVTLAPKGVFVDTAHCCGLTGGSLAPCAPVTLYSGGGYSCNLFSSVEGLGPHTDDCHSGTSTPTPTPPGTRPNILFIIDESTESRAYFMDNEENCPMPIPNLRCEGPLGCRARLWGPCRRWGLEDADPARPRCPMPTDPFSTTGLPFSIHMHSRPSAVPPGQRCGLDDMPIEFPTRSRIRPRASR